jgi:hypothetical protein
MKNRHFLPGNSSLIIAYFQRLLNHEENENLFGNLCRDIIPGKFINRGVNVMQHHTKEKGDLAVAMVIADMKKNGIGLALPISEHMPFDLIAVDFENGCALRKVQVKYATCQNGKIMFNLRASYADRHGSHVKHVDRSTFDAYAIYCRDTDTVYYGIM